MRGRRGGLALLLIGVLLAVLAAAGLLAQARARGCQPVPLLAPNLLPNAGLARAAASSPMPDGWSADAPGAQLRGPGVDGQGFDYDGDGRALQLIGIANAVEAPPAPVQPGRAYCAAARALTDTDRGGATRVRATLRWLDSRGGVLAEDAGAWQAAALWRPGAPPADWGAVGASAVAPPGAASLVVRLQASSDDRVYLDALRVQDGGDPAPRPAAPAPAAVRLGPWPGGRRGALSFSFDWETAMGGLVHSRSADDPYGDQDYMQRAMRMRAGVTTTLALFAPHGIRATYFANGYNFLLGNAERRTFMGDPTFAWARVEQPYAWRTDAWTRAPWFSPDPHGTVASDPGWYFGDLVPRLLAAGQSVESHTFSHMYVGFATAAQLREDLAAWRDVAAERGVAPATALAFPWSGSAGVSDEQWAALEAAGITAVTRTNRSQRQYQIVRAEDVRCLPVPGHERILACPDFYLTPRSAPQALALIARAVERGGAIDLWAHTEEVTSADQLAAWGQVVADAARRSDAGELWVAPLAEIASWQQALAQVDVTSESAAGGALRFTVANRSGRELAGLSVELPAPAARAASESGGGAVRLAAPQRVELDLRPGESVTVRVEGP